MALQKTIFVTGRIANLIFYELHGKPCVRAMPAKVRQTRATKAAAGQFGEASRISKYLRGSLGDFLPNYKDRFFRYKMNNVARRWLQLRKGKGTARNAGLPLEDWLDYNAEALLENRCTCKLQLDWSEEGKLHITLPKMNPRERLQAPVNTHTLHFRFAVGGCEVKKGRSFRHKVKAIALPYKNAPLPAQTLTIPYEVKPDALLVVALEMQYERTKNGEPEIVKNMRWIPRGVVGSWYAGG